MKGRLFILTLSLLSCGCCSLPETEPYCETLNVCGDNTRLALSSGWSTIWNYGDLLTVFHHNNVNTTWTYVGNDGSPAGEISYKGSSTTAESDENVALFPVSPEASYSDGRIFITYPSEQKVKSAGNVAPIMAGRSNTSDIKLHYASALVKVTLTGAGDVKSVSVRGNDSETISGGAVIDLAGDCPELTFTDAAAGKVIRTSNEDGGLLGTVSEIGLSLYSSIPAIKFEKGLTLSIEYGTGGIQDVLYSDAIELKPGQVLNLMDVPAMEKRDIVIDFTKKNFDSFYRVFFPKLTLSESEYVTTGTYNFQIGESVFPFTFSIIQGSATSAYHYIVDNVSPSYLRIRGNTSYIKLPRIDGWMLTEVSITEGRTLTPEIGSSHELFITTDVSSKTSASMAKIGDSITAPCEDGQVQSIEIGSSDPALDYYLYVNAGGYAYIRCISVSYVRQSNDLNL